MIFFPDRTVTHPGNVVEGVQREFRKDKDGERVGPGNGADQTSWDVVDEASWGSFPASDAPPWTLGYSVRKEVAVSHRETDE